ncbi:MAG: hypothetical protein PHP26_08255 [Syntrophomonas sp.]|uniref:hypothetical protein n=1 Tax=Syntrophomonas sp. TaxID=2053627 RepID=UPI00260660FA|nr:hypothetical protein [Syntrophomonas sp.]MDD2510533.1 hypothetical protein [Syntrophomonas sp.]MDD3879966.1 hypothetical protein [Syntrophomonas sp.]MDD4626354.1 hypothetical protein [Syntrophomonas sp.]
MEQKPSMEEKKLSILKVNAQKYRATQLAAGDEESLFMISTAKKSKVKAKNLCPRCQERVNKQEMKTCKHCGSELCGQCLNEYQEKLGKTSSHRVSSAPGN